MNDFGDNKYVFGINSQTTINGKLSKGNLYILGLDSKIVFGDSAELKGNLFSAGIGNGEISLGTDSKITGDTSAYGVALGWVLAEHGATITGNIYTGGFNAQTPQDIRHGVNSLLNLEDYTF